MIHLAALLLQVAGAPPASGEALLTQMHARWNGKWSTTRTFVQRTVIPGQPDQTWYESEQSGMLRIDVAPVDSMNAQVMRNDSIFVFRRGTVRPGRPYANTLGLLLVDVYLDPVPAIAAKLRAAGMDLTKIRSDRFDGHDVWVVGAAAGDTVTPQFWIDKERLLLTRVYDKLGAGLPFEGRVTQRMSGAIPVESEMVFLVGGVERQREYYNDIKLNVPLEAEIFDNKVWHRPAWIPKSPN
jgi:hypothetical protein